jgi:hypothetical protein
MINQHDLHHRWPVSPAPGAPGHLDRPQVRAETGAGRTFQPPEKRTHNFGIYGWRRPGETAIRTALPHPFADTEGVTGSNPVAPTTVLAGQGPVSAWRTALLTCRGRAAAVVCSLVEPDGPSGTDDTGPSPARRPRSVVTTSLSSPWSGTTPATCPGCTAGGLVSTCWFSCSPANRPAPWRWTSSLVGQAARRRRSLCEPPRD